MATRKTPDAPTAAPVAPTPDAPTAAPEIELAAAPSATGSTFAERRAARLNLPMPAPVEATPAASTFAERRAARLEAKPAKGVETK